MNLVEKCDVLLIEMSVEIVVVRQMRQTNFRETLDEIFLFSFLSILSSSLFRFRQLSKAS